MTVKTSPVITASSVLLHRIVKKVPSYLHNYHGTLSRCTYMQCITTLLPIIRSWGLHKDSDYQMTKLCTASCQREYRCLERGVMKDHVLKICNGAQRALLL